MFIINITPHKAFLLFLAFSLMAHSLNARAGLVEEDGNKPIPALFSKIDSNSLNSLQKQSKGDISLLRSRYVKINFDAFAITKDSHGAKTIKLNLFNDVTVIAIKDRFESRSSKRYSWFGKVKGKSLSNVILTVGEQALYGRIEISGIVYKVEPVKNTAAHRIIHLNPQSIVSLENDFTVPPDNLQVGEQEKQDAIKPTAKAEDSGSVIDALVLYTDGMAEKNPGNGIITQIDHLVDLANQAYANSGIDLRLNVVKTMQVSYPDGGATKTALNNLTNSVGVFANVPGLRNQYAADIVVLVRDYIEVTACGEAWLMESNSSSFEDMAFSVVQVGKVKIGGGAYVCSEYTFTHEIGHNMGGGHGWNNDCSAKLPSLNSYSNGYGLTGVHFGTIMYTAAVRLGYFSNPDLAYEGHTLGIPEGQPCAADNSKSMAITKSTIARFRNSSTVPYPDIKANDSDESITITGLENLKIVVSLNINEGGQNADWWLVKKDPSGDLFYYDLPGKKWLPGFKVTYQGPLGILGSYEVLNKSGLSPGVHTYYFGVGPKNGSLANLIYDSIIVNVTE